MRIMARVIIIILFFVMSSYPQDLNTIDLMKDPTDSLFSITLETKWDTFVQFIGYYIALEKGFYKEVGLDVSIITGVPQLSVPQALVKGEADIGISHVVQALMASSQGMDVVNICQVFPNSSILLVARNSVVQSKLDLAGMHVGVWEQYIPHAELLKEYDDDLEFSIYPVRFTNDLFVRGALNAVFAMSYNEYIKILHSGVLAENVYIYDILNENLPMPEDGLYCTREFYEAHPEECRNFVAATKKGWDYALNNRKESVTYMVGVMTDQFFYTNYYEQNKMFEEIYDRQLADVEPDDWGVLNEQDYVTLKNLIEKVFDVSLPDYSTFYVNVLQ